MSKARMERDPFVEVVSMDAESARSFFGADPDALVEDVGPPSRPERYKDGARCFRIWLPDIRPAARR